MALRVLTFLLAAILSQGIVQLVLWLLPDVLRTTAPVIGYPVFANFNINRLFEWYYLQGLFFPGLTLFIYLRKFPMGWEFSFPKAIQLPEYPGVKRFLKLLFTGLVLSFVSLPWKVVKGPFYWQAGLFACSYVVGVVLFCRWQKRWETEVNLLLVPLAWFALFGASSATGVIEAGKFIVYPWFPFWLALALAVITGAILVRKKRQCRDRESLASLETETLFLFLVPLCVFLSQSRFTPLRIFEVFHFGEYLVPGLLLTKGYFPWRDLFFSHGLLQDPLQSVLGHFLFEESFWGAAAGMNLIYMPLYWVANYFLADTLFPKKRFFLLALFFILPFLLPGFFSRTHFRFLLWPFILIVFSALMREPSRLRVVGFCFLLFVQAIVTPESAYAVIASVIALLVADAMVSDFRRTGWFVLTGACLTLGWFLFLFFHDAHWAFVEYYQTFVPHHRLTGGLPLQTWTQWDPYCVYAPLILNIFFFWYFGLKLLRKKQLSSSQWTLFLVYLFMVFYYQKFLGRADSHIYAVYAMASPLLFWFFDLAFSWLGQLARIPQFCSVIVVVGLCVFLKGPWPHPLFTVRQQLKFPADSAPKIKRLGYFELSPEAENYLTDIKKYLDSTLSRDEKIFDFSNSPGLYFYLLDRRPSTRFFHISMAIRLPTQRVLIRELERDKPKLVVFHGKSDLGSWDGIPNMVRHFEVSRYLLTHYEPARKIGDSLVLLRRAESSLSVRKPTNLIFDLQNPEATSVFQAPLQQLANGLNRSPLYFETEPCQWGYTPHFMRTWKDLKWGEGESVPFSQRREKDQFVVEFPLPEDRFRYSAIEIEFEKLQRDKFYLLGPDREKNNQKNYITFHSLAENHAKYWIPVGSCSQWYGYSSDRLRMTHKAEQTITAIKFVRAS